MPSPCVEIDQVSLSFGATSVLRDMSWRAMPGQVTAILGPNGAGKSTSMLLCEGLLKPDSGQLRVLGHDPLVGASALRPRVGVMVQEGGLPVMARPRQLLDHVAGLYASPRDPDALAKTLGIDDFATTSVRRLSVGQRQRLALALALVGRGELVFLDEPTAGLDAHGRDVVWELIAGLRDAGTSVVLSTHVMEEAEVLADHVVIIDRGRVVASGSPEDLIASTAPDIDPGSGSAADSVSPRDGEVVISGELTQAAWSELQSLGQAYGLQVRRRGSRGSRGLAQVFRDLTGGGS